MAIDATLPVSSHWAAAIGILRGLVMTKIRSITLRGTGTFVIPCRLRDLCPRAGFGMVLLRSVVEHSGPCFQRGACNALANSSRHSRRYNIVAGGEPTESNCWNVFEIIGIPHRYFSTA